MWLRGPAADLLPPRVLVHYLGDDAFQCLVDPPRPVFVRGAMPSDKGFCAALAEDEIHGSDESTDVQLRLECQPVQQPLTLAQPASDPLEAIDEEDLDVLEGLHPLRATGSWHPLPPSEQDAGQGQWQSAQQAVDPLGLLAGAASGMDAAATWSDGYATVGYAGSIPVSAVASAVSGGVGGGSGAAAARAQAHSPFGAHAALSAHFDEDELLALASQPKDIDAAPDAWAHDRRSSAASRSDSGSASTVAPADKGGASFEGDDLSELLGLVSRRDSPLPTQPTESSKVRPGITARRSSPRRRRTPGSNGRGKAPAEMKSPPFSLQLTAADLE